MSEQLADELKRLCCAETEGKFFDCVTDNIDTIITALRGRDVMVKALEDIAEFCSGDMTTLGSIARLASIQSEARNVIAAVTSGIRNTE